LKESEKMSLRKKGKGPSKRPQKSWGKRGNLTDSEETAAKFGFHPEDYSTRELQSLVKWMPPEAFVYATGKRESLPLYRNVARMEIKRRLGPKDPSMEFKDKRELKESEVKKMNKLLNNGTLVQNDVFRQEGYSITREHREKGIAFLRRYYEKRYGKGEGYYRNMKALGWDFDKNEWRSMDGTRIRMKYFYRDQQGVRDFYYPIYSVSGHGQDFDYYYEGGTVHETS
jgi:hypothetical protein